MKPNYRKHKHHRMDNKNKTQDPELQQQAAEAAQPEIDDVAVEEPAAEPAEEPDQLTALGKELADAKAELEKEKKQYLFLMADFDNFRKRTLKEKSELIKNGAEAAMKGLLPIVDDFERGLQAVVDTEGAEAVKEGMTLIYNKFVKYLEKNGVKVMDTNGADFNDELHEAVALVPGPEEQKGKIIDTLEKGYMINDKVLRHAKVAVGQ